EAQVPFPQALGHGRSVRSDKNIVESPEFRGSRQRLLIEDVKRRSRNAAMLERVEERWLVYELSTAHVHQVSIFFHLLDARLVDDARSLRGERRAYQYIVSLG